MSRIVLDGMIFFVKKKKSKNTAMGLTTTQQYLLNKQKMFVSILNVFFFFLGILCQ